MLQLQVYSDLNEMAGLSDEEKRHVDLRRDKVLGPGCWLLSPGQEFPKDSCVGSVRESFVLLDVATAELVEHFGQISPPLGL